MTKHPVNLPIEDDSTYLAIVHPYPPNANLQLATDRRTLALWLACCTGNPDVLRAMFHKPKAAGMVIIEVDREFEGFDALLGMHSWLEFLLAPTEEEAGKSSKVFYCIYHNAEAVRNAGWNRVEIEDHWFQEWRLDNDLIKHPYPKATYCDVPPESRTGVPLCHRLPQRLFATPPRQELPAHQAKKLKEVDPPKHSTTAVAMMAIFGTAPKASSFEGGATAGASTSGVIPVGDQSRVNDEAAVEDNPWDGYNTPRPDPPIKVKKRGGSEWICPKHGPTCIPGICQVRARVDRDERWQKEREERAENKRKWMERNEKKARKSELIPAGGDSEGRELPHRDQPVRLVNGPSFHDQGSLRFRPESPDSEEECTQTVISADEDEFPMSTDMGREHPIVEVQSSSALAGGIGATRLGDDDDRDDGVIETETGIQDIRIRERNKDKGKGKIGISLNGHRPDFEKVLPLEVPGDIGRSWCESGVEW